MYAKTGGMTRDPIKVMSEIMFNPLVKNSAKKSTPIVNGSVMVGYISTSKYFSPHPWQNVGFLKRK